MDDGTGSVRGLSASSRTERTCVIAALSGEPGVAGHPGPVSEAIRAAKTRVERDIATPGVGELLTAYYDPAAASRARPSMLLAPTGATRSPLMTCSR